MPDLALQLTLLLVSLEYVRDHYPIPVIRQIW